MRSIVTIDVEGTVASPYRTTDPYSSVEKLASHLTKVGLPVTLFITPDVVENCTEIVSSWLERGVSLGLHLHPARLDGGTSDRLSHYDRDAIEEFIAVGCDAFESRLDTTPNCFRAGRWEYSSHLLEALRSQGFERDSSLKSDTYVRPYTESGIKEYPLTVYSNFLVRTLTKPWQFRGIPMHADAFLSNTLLAGGFYGVTWRLVHSNCPYIMVSYHDYDILDQSVCNRLVRYQRFLGERTEVTTLDQL